MANKTARTKGSRRHSTVRRTPGAKRPVHRERWEKVLERYLIQEGYSPAEAKELVEISAA